MKKNTDKKQHNIYILSFESEDRMFKKYVIGKETNNFFEKILETDSEKLIRITHYTKKLKNIIYSKKMTNSFLQSHEEKYRQQKHNIYITSFEHEDNMFWKEMLKERKHKIFEKILETDNEKLKRLTVVQKNWKKKK